MVSNKTSKFIKSLQLKKNRVQEKKFVVEGIKSVNELLVSDFDVTHVLATEKYLEQCAPSIKEGLTIIEVTSGQLSKLSNFKNNDSVLAVAKMKELKPSKSTSKVLALDMIKDPGNMGTIIRIADWYGIHEIICSEACVDFYNPKVIQATMGSFARIKVIETNLTDYLKKVDIPILGAVMEGESVHTFKFPNEGLLVIGNESRGISSEIAPFLNEKITIPSFGQAESLNAGIATAIICDRWVSAKV